MSFVMKAIFDALFFPDFPLNADSARVKSTVYMFRLALIFV